MSFVDFTTPPDVQKNLYASMLYIRMVEEKIVELYPQQEMKCPCHLCIGQEAISAGLCASLRRDDKLFGTYRGHGIYLAKGGDLKAMFAELYGKKTGCTKGKGGSMQLVAPEEGLLCTSAIVGGTIPMAVGAAMAASMDGGDQVAAVMFGEGATEEGVFHESLNFAALKTLPVVFVCEHNYFACYSHQNARQSQDNVYERAAIYGIPASRIDGNNALEVHKEMETAVARARNGGGPTLVECRTYRWLEHVGPYNDTNQGYRTQEEVDEWMERCPLRRLSEHLLKAGILDEVAANALKVKFAEKIDEAVLFALDSPFPEPEALHDDVYYSNKEAV